MEDFIFARPRMVYGAGECISGSLIVQGGAAVFFLKQDFICTDLAQGHASALVFVFPSDKPGIEMLQLQNGHIGIHFDRPEFVEERRAFVKDAELACDVLCMNR